MIFITLGSQKFQFNRLLKYIDELIEKDILNSEEVFAQIGASDYLPKNYLSKNFVTREEFQIYMAKSEIVLTHGGTGAIVTALKKNKLVIATPRQAKYGEHVDDHQFQIVKNFTERNLILSINNIEELEESLGNIRSKVFDKFESNNDLYISTLSSFINN